MEFTNTFTIPVGIDEAFDVLTDLERVAPCMPGATLEGASNGTYEGQVKVKLGPMSLAYRGTAEVVEQDRAARTARIVATGKESRGSGTARADVTAELTEVGDETQVVVRTKLDVTGRPAQFGRGVLADVGANIISTFADNLAEQLSPEEVAEEPTAGPAPEATTTSERSSRPAAASGDSDALDLAEVGLQLLRDRAVPILATLLALCLLTRLFRRR